MAIKPTHKMKKKLFVLLFLPFLLVSCGGKGGLSPELKSCIKNPECASSDGRLIIGYTIDPKTLNPDYRGPGYMVAVYEGDPNS